MTEDSLRPEKLVVRDFRKAKFFWLDNEIVDDFLPRIGGTAFAVYAYLCRYASSATQECWPSMSQMAERLQLSKSTVWRCLIALREVGLIKIEKGERGGDRHEPNTYVLLTVKTPSSVGETRKPSSPSSPSSIPSSKPSSATVPEQDLVTRLTEQGETPPDLHPMQYATKILEQIGMTHVRANLNAVTEAINLLVREGKSRVSAYEFLNSHALDAIDRGEIIDKWWFEDAKWKRPKKAQPKLINAVDEARRQLAEERAREKAHAAGN